MSSMGIETFSRIEFVKRYENLCKKHNNFGNRMKRFDKLIYNKIIDKFNYKITYIKKDKIYEIIQDNAGYKIILRLILKDGIIEPFLFYSMLSVFHNPCGRFDFICEKINKNFNREIYSLPIFSSEQELEIILKEIFSLYEDFKKEFIMRIKG